MMDNNSKKKPPKPTIHTTISQKALNIFTKYLKLRNEEDESIYSSKANIIEEALELFDKHHDPEVDEAINTWKRFRQELNMVSVGKPTFLAYISGDYRRAFKENIAVEILEWYKKLNVDKMSMEEFLNALKDLWIAGNYFYKVDIEKLKGNGFKISFYLHIYRI